MLKQDIHLHEQVAVSQSGVRDEVDFHEAAEFLVSDPLDYSSFFP